MLQLPLDFSREGAQVPGASGSQGLYGLRIRRLGIGEAVAEEAIRILDSIKEKISFVGKDPTGYVAAAIYIASRKLRRRISKSRLAAEIGVTEVTIRARIREVAEKLGIDVDGRKRRASRSKNIS
jgi:hypothetical protein